MTEKEKEKIDNIVELLTVSVESLNEVEDEVDDEGKDYIKKVVNESMDGVLRVDKKSEPIQS